MTKVDILLQNWRIRKAGRFLAQTARVLDIGCSDGALFHRLQYLKNGTGIDPDLKEQVHLFNADLYPGYFPADLPAGDLFDAITMLAVMEHIPPDEQQKLVRDCYQWLKPSGLVILTLPSPKVDHILVLLRSIRLVHAATLHQHFGFDAHEALTIFGSAGFSLVHASKFQLGLNNLFVFRKPGRATQL